MKSELLKTQFAAATIVGLVLGVSTPAFAQVFTMDIIPSSAPNASGSPSWAGYAVNALNSLENGLGTTGDRTTSPTAYEVAGSIVEPGDFLVTSFNSWRGVAGPLASPFNNEYGNRMHFGLHAYGDGTSQFTLENLTFALHSSDPDDGLLFVGNFIGYAYNGVTRYGVNWGADRTKGGGDDIVYLSGNGTTLVDELVYVGVGNAFWPDGTVPNQAVMDDTANWILSNAPFAITCTYSILGDTQSATVTVVPEPATFSLLVLGGLALMLRRRG